ncbi:MAG: SH3 domain-containing protein [Thermodesulfobacteriota bacterium]
MPKPHRLLLAGFLLVAAVPAIASLPWMSVSVREGILRETPMPFGKVLASLGYGAQVDILAEQGQWRKVRDQQQGREGWMHAASLVDKKITLQAGEKVGAAASQDELALGGKGFNAEVEAAYRAKGQGLDYPAVDRMERLNVASSEQECFLRDGGLVARNEEEPR